MQKITPFLWFDSQAAEAANYYISVFGNGRITSNSPMVVSFEIHGQPVMGLNGGPQFKFTEAFSFYVNCKDQAEVDSLWNRLIGDGGVESQCGWLKDKYGLSWQIIPEALMRTLGGSDAAGAQRAMQAMLKMKKIVAADLELAHKG